MGEREDLLQAIQKLESQRPQLGDAVVDTAIAALRERLRTLSALTPERPSDFASQRKQVTVLFSDLAGFTALSEKMDPEDLRAVMNAYFEQATDAIARHGGTVEKFIGDAVMALFGVPKAGERDPENAVRAALAMRRTLDSLNADLLKKRGIRLAQRIGINTGVVFASVSEGEDLKVVGSAVNVASRLEHAAPTGGILISQDTYRHVRGIFDVVELEPITVKGVADPIPVFLVEREKPRAFRLQPRGVEGIETRMVGRDPELALLQQAFAEVVEKRAARLITAVGEAGVGKSRLLYEFTNWLELRPEVIRLFKGRIDGPTGSKPYGLARDFFSFRFEIRDNDSPSEARAKLERGMAKFMGHESQEKAHIVGQLLGFDFSESPHLKGIRDEAKQIRDRAFFHIAQFFSSVSKDVPAVALFLEDVHWADEGSLDLVHYLARECGEVPLLLLCLTRPSLFEKRASWCEEPPSHLRVDLKPLTREDSRNLVTEILCRVPAVPQELEELVVRQAEGYPFYLEEFIKMLIEERVILKGNSSWQVVHGRLAQLRVPPTLTGVLQARLDGLPKAERVTLQMAAMVGRVFWDSAVARIEQIHRAAGPGEDLGGILHSLQEKELIFERAGSTFGRAREFVFKHALLHDVAYESVLKQVRQRYHAEVADWLAEESGEQAPQHASLIGEHLEKAGELEKASGWFEKAGEQAKRTFAPADAARYFQRALAFMAAPADAPAIRRRMEIHGLLGEVLVLQALYGDAAQAFRSMLQGAESIGDESCQARAWNGLSWVQDRQGDFSGALDSAVRADSLARAAGSKAELARALFRRGWALFRMGKADAVLALAEQALALSTELEAKRDVAFSFKLLGIAHILAGRFEEAEGYQKKALGIFEELGDRWGVANLLNNLGENARLSGDYEKAARTYEREMVILGEIGNRDGEIICLNNLGAAKVEMGEFEAAEQDLARSLRLGEQIGANALSETLRFLAEAKAGLGKTEEALALARRALETAKRSEYREDLGAAYKALATVASRLGGRPAPDGEILDASALFEASANAFAEAGAHAERARALRDWAHYEGQRGDPGKETALREEAFTEFRRLGLHIETARMQGPLTDG